MYGEAVSRINTLLFTCTFALKFSTSVGLLVLANAAERQPLDFCSRVIGLLHTFFSVAFSDGAAYLAAGRGSGKAKLINEQYDAEVAKTRVAWLLVLVELLDSYVLPKV